MRDIVIDVGDIEIPRYVEVFDTAMHHKEYFATLQEAAAYIQVTVPKIVDALCSDVEVRIKGRYRVDILTDEDEEEEPFFHKQIDIIFRNYRTNEVVIVGSIEDAKLKTGIDERIINKRLEEPGDSLASEFVFRKAEVNKSRAWPSYTEEELTQSKTDYFAELKENVKTFSKRNRAIDSLLKDLLHEQYVEMRGERELTDDQRRHYLPLLDKGLEGRYKFDTEVLVKHVKENVKFLKREFDHMLDHEMER